MKRKVIQLAGKTLLVSLPIKWVKKYGIKKGNELEVEEREKSLLVATEKAVSMEKREIVLSGPEEFIRRVISVEYKKGVNEITFKFEDPKTINIVKDEISKLMGFEIISQGEKFCVVKSIASGLEEEFDNILRRAFLVMIGMSRDIHDAVKKKEHKRLREIETADITINKLTDFCKRILNTKGYRDYRHSSQIYTIIWGLERIGDEYKGICKSLENEKSPVSKETVSLLDETNRFFDDFYHLFYKFSQEAAGKFTNMKKNLQKSAFALARKKKGSEALALHSIMNIITGTYNLAGQYYAMVI